MPAGCQTRLETILSQVALPQLLGSPTPLAGRRRRRRHSSTATAPFLPERRRQPGPLDRTPMPPRHASSHDPATTTTSGAGGRAGKEGKPPQGPIPWAKKRPEASFVVFRRGRDVLGPRGHMRQDRQCFDLSLYPPPEHSSQEDSLSLSLVSSSLFSAVVSGVRSFFPVKVHFILFVLSTHLPFHEQALAPIQSIYISRLFRNFLRKKPLQSLYRSLSLVS